MNLKALSKAQLLELKEELDLQLKLIDDLNAEIKLSKEKIGLSSLKNDDKIFCIHFIGSEIIDMDYVRIKFYKNEKDVTYKEWTNFSVQHDTKPLGLSSAIEDVCLDKHYFLHDFCSHMHFFTLKPENWKVDLKLELERHIKSREGNFNKERKNFKKTITGLIKNNVVDTLINNSI